MWPFRKKRWSGLWRVVETNGGRFYVEHKVAGHGYSSWKRLVSQSYKREDAEAEADMQHLLWFAKQRRKVVTR